MSQSVTVYDAATDRRIRSLTGLRFVGGLALDEAHQELIVSRTMHRRAEGWDAVSVYPLDAQGEAAPLRTIMGPHADLHSPTGVLVDPLNDELVVANDDRGSDQGFVAVFRRTATGDEAPLRTIAGPHTHVAAPSGIALDGDDLIVVDASHSEHRSSRRLASTTLSPTGTPARSATTDGNTLGRKAKAVWMQSVSLAMPVRWAVDGFDAVSWRRYSAIGAMVELVAFGVVATLVAVGLLARVRE